MSPAWFPSDQVDQLLRNAQLRDELEPFVDESLQVLHLRPMPLEAENEFLASMLAWERAPVLPIRQWFSPELQVPSPDSLSDEQLSEYLHRLIECLYEQRIVLDFTEHLSDRQLYRLIYRDILPSYEKKVDLPRNYLHWHCLDENDIESWLRFYASDDERQQWESANLQLPPPKCPPPHPRRMPLRPPSSRS
jgi:hypothetical protein